MAYRLTPRFRYLLARLTLIGVGVIAIWGGLLRRHLEMSPTVAYAQSGVGPQVAKLPGRLDNSYSGAQKFPAIAAGTDGALYAVWEDWRTVGSEGDIYFCRSTDGGDYWPAPDVQVDDGASGTAQRYPDVAVDADDNVYAVWEDYRNSAIDPDIGFAWADPYTVAMKLDWSRTFTVHSASAVEATQPALAVSPAGDAYVVWQDKRNGNWDIYFAYASQYSITNGLAWHERRVDDGPGVADQMAPAIGVDTASKVYAVWEDHRDGVPAIRLAYATVYTASHGLAWSSSAQVNNLPVTATQLALAVSANDYLYATWVDERISANGDIFFASSPSPGLSWSPAISVSSAPGYAHRKPAVAALGSEVAVAWQDGRGSYWRIYYNYGMPELNEWAGDKAVNAVAAHQYDPDVAITASGAAIVWWDEREHTDGDIYFALHSIAIPLPTLNQWGWGAFVLILFVYAVKALRRQGDNR